MFECSRGFGYEIVIGDKFFYLCKNEAVVLVLCCGFSNLFVLIFILRHKTNRGYPGTCCLVHSVLTNRIAFGGYSGANGFISFKF